MIKPLIVINDGNHEECLVMHFAEGKVLLANLKTGKMFLDTIVSLSKCYKLKLIPKR